MHRRRGTILAAIALGGALGAPARYGVAQLVHVAKGSFPWATFWTNVTGSFALGLVLVLILERFPPTRYVRPFVATGFLGAYTTYSTFAVETDLLVRGGQAGTGVVYGLASLVAGFVAVWAGMLVARAIRLPMRAEG
ncbi:MAG: CrcB family protein [Actinobacteria bacterium]|jgi:CrcB protein|nr:CrcB family protein [Actinomycetota bacterium]